MGTAVAAAAAVPAIASAAVGPAPETPAVASASDVDPIFETIQREREAFTEYSLRLRSNAA